MNPTTIPGPNSHQDEPMQIENDQNSAGRVAQPPLGKITISRPRNNLIKVLAINEGFNNFGVSQPFRGFGEAHRASDTQVKLSLGNTIRIANPGLAREAGNGMEPTNRWEGEEGGEGDLKVKIPLPFKHSPQGE